jgi:hypothetical protein
MNDNSLTTIADLDQVMGGAASAAKTNLGFRRFLEAKNIVSHYQQIVDHYTIGKPTLKSLHGQKFPALSPELRPR